MDSLNNQYQFVRIKKDKSQIDELYKLLGMRKYNISNQCVPDYSEHQYFVLHHPYRAWYLIYEKAECIGSMYLMKNNCISINILNDNIDAIKASIKWVINKFKPLVEIKSVRPKNFNINVSPMNWVMKNAISEIGGIEIQVTYSIPTNGI
jgi:hypothetical protein